MEAQEVADVKQIGARQGRTIVFIDESGLSECRRRARTWAPKGQKPTRQYSFCWKQLSVIAGVNFVRFYFRLFASSIRSPQIVEFLKALLQIARRKLPIAWDRMQAHRSRLVSQYVEQQRRIIALEFLTAYAPELNPVERIWGYLKTHAMPNFCARYLGDLTYAARRRVRSMHQRPTLISAFWKQTELF
jgi:transposase